MTAPLCRCPPNTCYLHPSLRTCGMRERGPDYFGRSNLYHRSRNDEQARRNKVLRVMILALAIEARIQGAKAIEDMHLCWCAGQDARIRFHAYFAGVNARAAFTIAQRVLDLNAERDDPREVDWKKELP